MATQSIINRANANFIDSFWALQKEIPGARIERWPDATATFCANAPAFPNTLFVMRAPPDPRALMRRARASLGDANYWEILTASDLKDLVGPAAEEIGMVAHEGMPGMMLKPIPAIPFGVSIAPVRHVTTMEGLQDFNVAVAEGYGAPVSMIASSFPKIPDLKGRGEGVAQLFVCYNDGRPVAGSALIESYGIGGIYWVATRSESRRHGFGAAVTWAAVEMALEHGCEACHLVSSKMGRHVYEQMGFRRVVDYPEWRTPDKRD
jgi:GNAT superfamily N-acetyltransferase